MWSLGVEDTATVFFVFVREGLGLVNRTANAFRMELAVQSVEQLAQSTEVTATAGKKTKGNYKVSKVPRIRRAISFAIDHLLHALNGVLCTLLHMPSGLMQ